ncbi:hypothetical protein V1292_005691 [Bradyrhizobium sp. AZCC 1719]
MQSPRREKCQSAAPTLTHDWRRAKRRRHRQPALGKAPSGKSDSRFQPTPTSRQSQSAPDFAFGSRTTKLRVHAFEKVLIAKHQTPIIHLKLGLKACRDAEIHVTHPIRTEPVVSLTGALYRHGRTVHETGIERETLPGPGRCPADREGVAEGGDRKVGLFRTIEIGTSLAVNAPPAIGPLKCEVSVAARAAPSDYVQRLSSPIRRQSPSVVEAKAAVLHADHGRFCQDRVSGSMERQSLQPGDVRSAPEQNFGIALQD